MNINNKKIIPLRLILISTILALGSVLFPPVSIIFLSFFTGMYIAESLKLGIIKTMLFFIIVCLIFGVVFSPRMGLWLFSLIAPLILGFHYCINSEYSVGVTVVVNAALFFIALMVIMYTQGGLNFASGSKVYLEQLIDTQSQILINRGATDAIITKAKINIISMYNTVIQLIPAIMVLSSLIISYWSFLFAGSKLIKDGIVIDRPDRFIYFKLPERIFSSIVAITLTVILFGQYFGVEKTILVNNLFLIFFTLFLIQGISILLYFTMKVGLPKIIRLVLIVFAIVTPGVQIIIALMGVIDNLLDLRKLKNL